MKLPGQVEPDAKTGQLKSTFDNNPQLPFTTRCTWSSRAVRGRRS